MSREKGYGEPAEAFLGRGEGVRAHAKFTTEIMTCLSPLKMRIALRVLFTSILERQTQIGLVEFGHHLAVAHSPEFRDLN